MRVKYDDSKLLGIVKIDDENEVHSPPFALLYFDLHTYSGLLASDDPIRLIKVRFECYQKTKRAGEDILFNNSEEDVILQQFSDYVSEKNPDIIICMGDYDDGKVLRYLFSRAKKIGFDMQLGRDNENNNHYSNTQENPRIRGRICISSSYRKTRYFDATKCSINRLIDSRNCFELMQKHFVIPSRYHSSNNHEHIRAVE